jgi:hypothetical protein
MLVTANIPSLLIIVTLTMELIRYCEMSVITRATWHDIPEDGIPYCIDVGVERLVPDSCLWY